MGKRGKGTGREVKKEQEKNEKNGINNNTKCFFNAPNPSMTVHV